MTRATSPTPLQPAVLSFVDGISGRSVLRRSRWQEIALEAVEHM